MRPETQVDIEIYIHPSIHPSIHVHGMHDPSSLRGEAYRQTVNLQISISIPRLYAMTSPEFQNAV